MRDQPEKSGPCARACVHATYVAHVHIVHWANCVVIELDPTARTTRHARVVAAAE